MARPPLTLFASLLIVGCTGTGLTTEQGRVLDQFEACRHEGPAAQLTEVQTNGHFTLTGRHSHIQLIKRCLSERFSYERFDARIREHIIDPGGP